MRVFTRCSHSFRKSKISVLLSELINFFMAVLEWCKSLSSYAVGNLILLGSADDMVFSPARDVLSAITRGGCNY